MNSKDYYESILTLTKSLNMLYINGVIESANMNVRKILEKGLNKSLDMQYDIYQQMKDDSFYSVENISKSEIKKAFNKLKENGC